jgi:hypothetical protein
VLQFAQAATALRLANGRFKVDFSHVDWILPKKGTGFTFFFFFLTVASSRLRDVSQPHTSPGASANPHGPS